MDIQTKYFKNGKLRLIPRKEKNKLEVLNYFKQVLMAQEKESFSEKEVNAIIGDIYDDYAIIRRYLVDYGYLLRDDYGRLYQINKEMMDQDWIGTRGNNC